MNHGGLFCGIGGFHLASEWMGWENVFHCEIEDIPRKTLQYYWPNAISYEDIKETDFTIHRGRIDILTGGFPCQPYSQAGKRLGKEDDRHLWPEMLRAIREITPRWVVGENVRGIINWNGGLVFDEVQADLEAEGYEVWPYVLPAAGVGAPHQRYRVWFVAFRNSNRCSGSSIEGDDKEEHGKGFQEGGQPNAHCQEQRASGDIWDAPHSSSTRTGLETSEACRQRWESPRTSESEILRQRNREADAKGASESCKHGDATNTKNHRCKFKPRRCQGRRKWGMVSGRKRKGCQFKRGRKAFAHATSNNQQWNGSGNTERQKQIGGQNYNSAWQNFPTQPPVCGGDDGLPTELDGITFSKWRTESIKAYGNAVVPQVVYQIFKSIEQYENQTT